MKRLKSALLLLTAIALTISITLGSFSVSAFAEPDPEFDGRFFTGNMITRVKEGADFTVPAPNEGVALTVTTPAGQTASQSDELTYTATQLGNYKVTYSANDDRDNYSYLVLSYEDREYSIKVTQTAEDFIPSLVATGTKLKMPKFELVYTNSKGDTVTHPTQVSGIEFDKDMATMSTEEGDNYLEVTNAGALNLTFWAKTGKDTTKKFIQEFTVNVQENFEDTISPVLNTLSLSTTANINALYTLPAASATDHHEKNIFIDIKVIDPDGNPVIDYKENDYGYADTSVETTEEVVFDNKNNRSFYPVQLGSYKITYVAIDGSGNRSIAHEYTIECRDRLAPVVEEFASDLVPAKWGLGSVFKGDGEEEPSAVSVDPSFKLPLPYVVDNATASDDLNLTLTIKNPANRIIGRWEGSIEDFKGEGVEIGSTYNSNFNSENQNFLFKAVDGAFDFSFKYINFESDRLNRDSEKYGDWVIEYAFRDEANNGGSGKAKQTATINLSKTFTDLNAPKVDDDLDLPKFVLINDENDSFEVPVVPLNTDDDTDLTINYTMKSSANITGMSTVTFEDIKYQVVNSHEVKGGEKYTIDSIDNKYFMLISEDNKDYAFLLDTSLVTLEFIAKDDVGNQSELKTIEIDILYAGSIEQEIVLAESHEPGAVSAPNFDLSDGMQRQEKVLGGFVINNVKHIDYTGFELSVLDPDGEPVEINAFTYNRTNVDMIVEPDEDVVTIYVDDITLTPKKDGIHTVNIRIYDISGKSSAYGYSFNVAKSNEQGGIIGESAARIEGTGTLRTEYELGKTFSVSNLNVENVIVREVSGFSFGIMNSTFIGLNTTTYRISDYVIEDYSHDWTEDDLDLRSSYTVLIENNEKPVIEIHDLIPKFISDATISADVPGEYQEGAYIELPVVTAYTKFENAVIEVTVNFEGENVKTHKIYEGTNGKTFKSTETIEEEEIENDFTGLFAFAAENEGEYKITIKAIASSGDSFVERTIIIGDRTPTSFTVSPIKKATVGNKYVITVPTADGDVSKVEVTLRGPDNSIINDATVSYTSISDLERNKQTTYSFADAGIYTVTYTITNIKGNVSSDTFEIEVTGAGSERGNNPAALTTILIIIGILLIIGVIVYVVRFRAVKK